RVRLARRGFLARFNGIFYSEGDKQLPREYKPGLRVGLPIWNWNQGGIARAEAERDRLVGAKATVHDRIEPEVRQAHLPYPPARRELDGWERQVRPVVEEAISRAQTAYQKGGAGLLLVLETTRQLLDARLREAQLRVDVRRAWAELERST